MTQQLQNSNEKVIENCEGGGKSDSGKGDTLGVFWMWVVLFVITMSIIIVHRILEWWNGHIGSR